MSILKLALYCCTLAALCLPSSAQSAEKKPDPASEQLLAQQIKHRSQFAQQLSARHLLARLTADELIAQHKFGQARQTVRLAQKTLASQRNQIPQSIFTFLDTLGREKLSTIDKKQLIFLRRRLAAQKARPLEPAATSAPITKASASGPPTRSLAQHLPTPPPRSPPLAFGPVRSSSRALRSLIPVVHYDDTALADVLDELRNKSGTNIVANWQSLANIGIEQTTPVSLELRNVSASRVLKVILQTISTPRDRASYIIQDNVVLIAASYDLDMIFEMRVHEVADLLIETRDLRGGLQFTPDRSGRTDGTDRSGRSDGSGRSGRSGRQRSDNTRRTNSGSRRRSSSTR